MSPVISISTDWLQKNPEKTLVQMGKSMMSGFPLALNQSITIDLPLSCPRPPRTKCCRSSTEDWLEISIACGVDFMWIHREEKKGMKEWKLMGF